MEVREGSKENSNKSVLCIHCKAPVPAHLISHEDPEMSFCCVGCEAVYHALGEMGLEQFYTWRELDSAAPRAAEHVHAGEEISQALFLEHARTLEDGTVETDLGLEGISCAGCVWLVEQMPRFVSGVIEAELNLSAARLRVRWQPESLERPHDVIVWLARFGYEAVPLRSQQTQGQDRAERAMLRRMGVSWALTGNVMLLSWAHYAGLGIEREPVLAVGSQILMALMVTGSVFYGGGIILRRAWMSARAFVHALVRGEGFLPLAMDVPLALGITLGWAYSGWAVWTGSGELWFDSIAMLVSAVVTARWLQQRANSRAKNMARQMLDIMPHTALRMSAEGVREEVSVDELLPGDLIEVRMGDVVAADGRIESGEGSLHRGVLTGESRPERVGEGALVEAGTKNVAGHFVMRVDAVGEHSRVGELLAWIHDQDAQRSEVLHRVDQLGGWFVAAILIAVCVAGVMWSQINPDRMWSVMIAMLVVSCPCAIGMATPLALALTMARGTRRGIFIKHDDALEALAELDVVVFDKTGTLTTGEMRVVETLGEAQMLALASALERRSLHPLAQAITRHGGRHDLDMDDMASHITGFDEVAALGVSAQVRGEDVRVGKPDWVLEACGASARGHHMAQACERAAREGASPVLMSRAGELVGMFAVADELLEDAPRLIQKLRRLSIRVQMLSGDHPALVDSMGARLGLEPHNVRGGCTPEDKLAHILRLTQAGERVMMVGDGVNDAAAMQAADVGVAVKGRSSVSLVAADIFLNSSGLRPIEEVLEASRRVRGLVRRNVAWLVVYNLVGIVLAGCGVVTPLIGAVLMPLSSLGLVALTIWTRTFDGSSGTHEDDDEHTVRLDSAGLVAGDGCGGGVPLGGESWGV